MRKLLYFLFLTLAAATATAKIMNDDLSQQLSIPNERYVLPNGLTVILSEDHSTPFVAINIWYQVGAVNEKQNKTGLAHLFEHLMFEGSRHVKASEHFRILEKAGAFDINASTSFDRTNYFQTVPKTQLETVLKLESSRMTFLDVDQAKLDEQRAVVRREREQRFETAPYGVSALKLWESIFPKNHAFRGRVIGSHADLEAARLKDVQKFYDRHYGPSNASLTIVGDFNRNEAKALIAKYFSTLPKTEHEKTPALPKIVLRDQEIIKAEEKIGKLPLMRIQYITPALYQPGDAELDVVAHVLTGGEYGRLTKAITRDKQLATATSAYQQSFEQLSVFTIDAVLLPGIKQEDLLKEIDNVLNGLVKQPVTPIEIERARNNILTHQFMALQELGGNGGRSELLQSYNRFANDPNFLQQDIMRYKKLNQDSVTTSSKQFLPTGRARKILFADPVFSGVAQKGN